MTQESRFFDSSTENQDSFILSFGLGGGDECDSKESSLNFIIECDSSVID